MKRLLGLILLAVLLPLAGLGEMTLHLSSDTIAVESVLDFTVEGADAPLYSYTLQQGKKTLFTSEQAPWAFGSYLPMAAGEYLLTATAHTADGPLTASASFTVTPQMTCDFSPLPASIAAGEPITLALSPRGGSGQYRYLYTVTLDGQQLLRQEDGPAFTFVPQQEGEYTLTALAADGLGAFIETEHSFRVTPGPGISLRPSGGALLGNGGQKSYTVYAPGPWTATTDCSFITLDTASGQPGDALILSISDAASAYREGDVIVESQGKRLVFSVGQLSGLQVEADVSLAPPVQTLLVEGEVHALWTDARDERAFTVSSDSAWQFAGDDFITLTRQGDQLILTLSPYTGSGVRQGLITLKNQDSAAYIHVYQLPECPDPAPALPDTPFPLPAEEAGFIIYSQSSGYWADKAYRHGNLERSGCAIFALSHALQHLGFTGEATRPENLAVTYAFALMKDGTGTMNSTLVGHAGDDFGFKTRYDLYKDLAQIRSKMDQGAVFSFSVVSGHIAMIIEKSPDGSMFRVVDSAPSATWERIKGASLYRQEADGTFVPLTSLNDLEGMRYYPQTNSFGGATYWLEARYIASRGARLIQPK